MKNIKTAEVLQENYTTPESIYDGRFSKTAQFMVPAIGINMTKPIIFKYFVNAYLNDAQHEHNYVRPIFLLFSVKDVNEKDWQKVYGQIITSPNYIAEYDVGIQDGKYLIMIVLQVPEEWATDYNSFRIGRYSRFSEKYKEKFPEFTDDKKEKRNIHWQIIHLDEDLKREIEKEYALSYGELDRPTIENGKVVGQPAKEIWDKPRGKREVYRYVDLRKKEECST